MRSSFFIASARLFTPNTHIRCSGGTDSEGIVAFAGPASNLVLAALGAIGRDASLDADLLGDFCNKIGTKPKNLAVERFLLLLGVQRKGLAQLSFVGP